ncbi:MAG: hypothetical protein ACKOFN_07390, partial [Vulcanococcus sp.]
DLFLDAAQVARSQGRDPSLLEQLQQRLAGGQGDGGAGDGPLRWRAGDSSLEFHACPGRLRQEVAALQRVGGVLPQG